ncbi:MAG: AAA family ATPase [Oscillatoriaceae cyanobacterium]
MKLKSIRLKNFKIFQSLEINQLSNMCVFVGANGTGKTTIFQALSFLKDAFNDNIQVALNKLGGRRGFQEVRSRNATDPIEFELNFYQSNHQLPLGKYFLKVNEIDGSSMAEEESITIGKADDNNHWNLPLMKFHKGEGYAISRQAINEIKVNDKIYQLKSANILALKGLAQFEEFPICKAIGDWLENLQIADFYISPSRPEQEFGYAENLSPSGENLALVTEFLYNRHPDIFQKIIAKLKQRVPGISNVSPKITEEGRVLLRFKDGDFQDPFLARYVSDGTLKMFSYLVLLYAPKPHSVLCMEEPENQLYPQLLGELVEEFRDYARQVRFLCPLIHLIF